MNRRVINQTLALDRSFIAPAVKAVLHTILFHRYFGNISPKQNTVLSGLTYASVDDTNVINAVEDKVQELMQTVSATSDSKAQICLYFTETKSRKAWFSTSEEEICWEEWSISIQSKVSHNRTESERNQQQSSSTDQAKKAIFGIIQEMDHNKDHIPLISNSQTNPFPYHITVTPASGLWSSMIKRAILPGI
ncbi:hypothetical protein LPJ66_004329 [Kickxella alabastrina]|uniref:Uncharacterized protein n=1 Tax=Kickxella alabastrina TaxID=61397 RepID=A0ACC1IHL1_9FUNG|nr:hypothetical protein LPJ66_004329 [Kickxella alabastrina]